MAISENATVGLSIIRVIANDPDYGSNADLGFTLKGGDGVFAINKTSGEFVYFLALLLYVRGKEKF